MTIGPERAYSFIDPGFPFRISRKADECLIALPFYRVLFLNEGPLLLLSRNEKRIIEGKSALFFPPDFSGSDNSASRKYSVKPGRIVKADTISFNQHFLDRITVSCWKNRSLQDFIAGLWNSGNQSGNTENHEFQFIRSDNELSEQDKRGISGKTSCMGKLHYAVRNQDFHPYIQGTDQY